MQIIDLTGFPALLRHFTGQPEPEPTFFVLVDWINNLWSYGEFASDDFAKLVDRAVNEVTGAQAGAPQECAVLLARLRDLVTDECPVCVDPLIDARIRIPVSVLPACAHGFHLVCIADWLARTAVAHAQPSCPSCRAGIDLAALPPALVGEVTARITGPGDGPLATSMISLHGIAESGELIQLVRRYNAESEGTGVGRRTALLDEVAAAVTEFAESARITGTRLWAVAELTADCRQRCEHLAAFCEQHPERTEALLARVGDYWGAMSQMRVLGEIRDALRALGQSYEDLLPGLDLTTAHSDVTDFHDRLRTRYDGPADHDDASAEVFWLCLERIPAVVLTVLDAVDERVRLLGDGVLVARREAALVLDQVRLIRGR
ncbi:hypothetical protein UK23_38270 [Lentzea aerocolonigenes]|uniref:RING-type domain-containing protein n=1 Tax=Lentzea aerocolonigenes TaxID=68170 RepID=A0A0F0GFR0_LENAE|nr:RING finger protein [Lentzea aerocolonigenes]KJK42185.1 hypothetical protein UK23_38270 [Lentzea aerocolonigenes]